MDLFDGIIVCCSEYAPERSKILKPLSFALFAIMNAKVHEFFPINPNDRTILILIFHEFLSERFHYRLDDLQKWMHTLIRLRERLNLVDVVEKLLSRAMDV